jgi:hypothetical protein
MTDVANAAYDGADAIMLRAETANGLFVEKVGAISAGSPGSGSCGDGIPHVVSGTN